MPTVSFAMIRTLERDRDSIKRDLEKPWRVEIRDALTKHLIEIEQRLNELRPQEGASQ